MEWTDAGVFALVIIVVCGIGSFRAQRGRAARFGGRAGLFHPLGASHSGAQGITQSVITIPNLFHTLTTGKRLS